MEVMQTLGVPYSNEEIANGEAHALAQAKAITENLVAEGAPEKVIDKEIIPLIAYLQRIGIDYGKTEETK